jgi:hypothetical protein
MVHRALGIIRCILNCLLSIVAGFLWRVEGGGGETKKDDAAEIFDFQALHGIEPRIADHTINAVPLYPFPAYEDLQLKAP